MTPGRSSRGVAEAKYRDVRLAALKKAEDIVADRLAPPAVHLGIITQSALHAFREQWEGHARRRYPWPWPEIVENARQNEPDRFEVAVRSRNTLCGLAIGWTRNAFCRVDYLEGSPAPHHPLKGSTATIVTAAARTYAQALGKGEIRLVDPIQEVVPHYEALGFTLVRRKNETPYCRWMI
jgi:hypothetical protein